MQSGGLTKHQDSYPSEGHLRFSAVKLQGCLRCRLGREIQMACELLYKGLTTGAGTQTLGEEYCDILQVAGACLSAMHWV